MRAARGRRRARARTDTRPARECVRFVGRVGCLRRQNTHAPGRIVARPATDGGEGRRRQPAAGVGEGAGGGGGGSAG